MNARKHIWGWLILTLTVVGSVGFAILVILTLIERGGS